MKLWVARKYRRSHRFWRDMLTDNPALVLGVDLPFIVACTNDLRNAVALSLMMLMIHTVTMVVARTMSIRLPIWLRSILNVSISTAMILVSRELVMMLFPNIANLVGIYLYLMAVNALTLIQANFRRGPTKLGPVVVRALIDVLAFTVLMLVISLVREFLGNGTLWGIPVPIPFHQPGILYPFFGFIFTGFLLAFLRRVNKLMVAYGIAEAERVDASYRALKAERQG